MDQVSSGAAVCSLDGRILAESDGLRVVANGGPGERELVPEARALIREHVQRVLHRDDAWSASSRADVPTPAGPYSMTASLMPPGMLAPEATALLIIRETGNSNLPEEDLRSRYRLTPREVEVARLIAQGESNLRIAELLKVSVNTVQHHAHGVLRKLGIRGRAGVASRLRRPGD